MRTRRALGGNLPPDRDHISAYPLRTIDRSKVGVGLPVVLGIPWYTGFDTPVAGSSDDCYYLPTRSLGKIRGYHCICAEPNNPAMRDEAAWWPFYNQGETPACEGFGHARRASLMTRNVYNAPHLYNDARRMEGTFPDGEGSTNRAACEALKRWGVHVAGPLQEVSSLEPLEPETLSISAFRWATTADQVLAVLGYATGSTIPLLQSWGTGYPQRVQLAPETLETLLQQEGEADVETNR